MLYISGARSVADEQVRIASTKIDGITHMITRRLVYSHFHIGHGIFRREYHTDDFDDQMVRQIYETKPRVSMHWTDKDRSNLVKDFIEGKYEFKPFRVSKVKPEQVSAEIKKISSQMCPDFLIFTDEYERTTKKDEYERTKKDETIIIRPSSHDDFLMKMAFAKFLFNFSLNINLSVRNNKKKKRGHILSDSADQFYRNIVDMGVVERLYILNLTKPLTVHCILERLGIHFHQESAVFKLLQSYLNSPYLDDKDNDITDEIIFSKPFDIIEESLYHIIYQNCFDSFFQKVFPKFTFTRFVTQVIIKFKSREKDAPYFGFFDKIFSETLQQFGTIVSIGPGDPSLYLYGVGMVVEIDSVTKRVKVEDINDHIIFKRNDF